MILERSVKTEDLVLVRQPKPCTAVLKVGDKVRLSSGSASLRVICIDGDDVTVEAQDDRGNPVSVTYPRVCWQKKKWWQL